MTTDTMRRAIVRISQSIAALIAVACPSLLGDRWQQLLTLKAGLHLLLQPRPWEAMDDPVKGQLCEESSTIGLVQRSRG